MILVAFILFAALVAGWLMSPGEVKEHLSHSPNLEPVASPAD
jgi:hypothetical protein